MNTHLKNRIESKLTIAEANQSIKKARSKFGFTAEDRAYIKEHGGKLGPWLEWKKSKKEAAKKSAATVATNPTPASSAAKPAPASSKPVTTSPVPKDDGLTITRAEFAALPPGDKVEFKRLGGCVNTASSATAPELAGLTGLARATAAHRAQSATSATTTPTAPKSTAPTLSGIDRAIAVHQGKAVQPSAPPVLTGLAAATAIHKQEAEARKNQKK